MTSLLGSLQENWIMLASFSAGSLCGISVRQTILPPFVLFL
ncbi:hypothetical protein AVEN_84511-1, partial [Araneus ventricosus]